MSEKTLPGVGFPFSGVRIGNALRRPHLHHLLQQGREGTSTIDNPNAAKIDEPVIGVVKIRIEAIDSPELLGEAITVLDAESRGLQGFLAAQILVSVDNKTMVILTEWSDHHAWSGSRYDVGVGKMLERCHAKSTSIEFELYTRRAEFTGTSDT
ncbi:MAG: hypothetical protein M3Y21_05080 [Candidatus Eremiobacteraeota bacterium]|nr:hypothetical protein [Candidatus Eremiobacteraeota bacterium]